MSSRPDCIFEIHQLLQSGFSRVYSNCICSCSFEREIIKMGQSSHTMYSNNVVNFQESITILNACTKKAGNLLKAPRNVLEYYNKSKYIYTYILLCIYIYIYIDKCSGCDGCSFKKKCTQEPKFRICTMSHALIALGKGWILQLCINHRTD